MVFRSEEETQLRLKECRESEGEGRRNGRTEREKEREREGWSEMEYEEISER